MEDGGKAGEGRCQALRDSLFILDKADINLLQLKPLSELVDFGRKPVCIPLEDAEGWLADSIG